LSHETRITVVGGGFAGLAAAYELARRGSPVTLLEAESGIGGLAGAFEVGGERLDCFYHHWYTNDREVMELIDELGLAERLTIRPTNTGLYYRNAIHRLSTPRDLLGFTPLSLWNRFRLGLLTLRARRVDNWQALEALTAREWLCALGGEEVFRVVWQPLLQGKFGPYAEQVSAVWFWNKLKLRGGSRGRGGEERLAYFRGGFIALAEAMAEQIRARGGRIETSARVTAIDPVSGGWQTTTDRGAVHSERVVVTTPLPLAAQLIGSWASRDYRASLERINYLGNICLVLELDRPLSQTYWLNINDPAMPFVCLIEHTNFVSPEVYGGRHLVYLSKYLPPDDPLYGMSADEYFEQAAPGLATIFPGFERSRVTARHLFRARWSQPVVERHYGALIPAQDGPIEGFHLCSMAQIYPEDRGTNYAVREGRQLGARLAALCRKP